MNRARLLAWLGLAMWTVIAALLLPLASKTGEVASTDPVQMLPKNAEATRALVREREAFPGTDAPVAIVVYVRDSGITATDLSTVESDRAAFGTLARESAIAPAARSEDGRALLLSFTVAGND